MQITYLGHSTVLAKSGPVSFLTDPVLSDRVLWLKRKTPLPVRPEDLPEATVILISHAHYDHLDLHSFKYFSSKTPIILPTGLGRLVSKSCRNPLIELSPGAKHEIGPHLKVTAFPVTHFSFRLSGLTYRGCNGYWIETEGEKIFFPGDTAYRTDFRNFKNPDVALLPIGPCRPEWFMRRRHLTPEDALRIAEEIEAKVTIPIHWGTFRLSTEPLNEPIDQLKRLVVEKQLRDRVRILNPGEQLTIN
jgi:L-ascorbate metabolism protein UlaG (beta-lactamase superfamily)